jgi:YD repeat-containing protein
MTIKMRLALSLVALSPLCQLALAPAQASGAKSIPGEMQVQTRDFKAGRLMPQSVGPKILELSTSGAHFTGLLGGIGTQNQCLSYTYDKNGNRTSQNNQVFGATATWGSSTYGCFSWISP